MTRLKFAAAGCAMLLTVGSAHAQDACGAAVTAKFIEGAPTDRFEITNASAGDWSIASVTIDLAPAPAGLVFDTADGGAGLEVFQPFKASDSSATLAAMTGLSDGGTSLTLAFETFGPGESFAFTTDIDDSLENSARRQTQVVGDEMEGAMIIVELTRLGSETLRIASAFDDQARLRAIGPAC